jgi:hypothetical protein
MWYQKDWFTGSPSTYGLQLSCGDRKKCYANRSGCRFRKYIDIPEKFSEIYESDAERIPVGISIVCKKMIIIIKNMNIYFFSTDL